MASSLQVDPAARDPQNEESADTPLESFSPWATTES
jgi:hypothetical protein